MKKFIFIFIVVALTFGCKFSDIFKKKEKTKSNLDKEYNITVPVTVSKSVKATLIKYVKTDGTAEAISNTDIIAEVSGTIDTIYVKDNQRVKANQKIMEIDRRNILLDIKQAQLEYDKAKAEFEAWKSIKNDLTEEQLKLQTGLYQKELQLKKLKIALEKTTVRAPFNGIVYNLNSVKGEYVSMGEKLFSIVDNDKMIIKVNVLEAEVNRIEVNADVIIKFSAITDKLYKGKVLSVSPLIEKDTHSCKVIIKIDNDGDIKDGMYAQVKISAEKYPDRILVYKDAILTRDSKKLVFAVHHNKAKWQYVKIGEKNEYFVEITKGVEPNQEIVIKGNFALSHDAKVKVVKEIPFEKLNRKF